jgi:hypothetical protein
MINDNELDGGSKQVEVALSNDMHTVIKYFKYERYMSKTKIRSFKIRIKMGFVLQGEPPNLPISRLYSILYYIPLGMHHTVVLGESIKSLIFGISLK